MASFADKFTTKEDSSTPSPPPSARKLNSGSPLDWILQSKSPALAHTLNELRNASLPESLVHMITSNLDKTDGNADCVKLLVCKTSPLIWGMQRACNATIDGDEQMDEVAESGNAGKGLNSFYRYLPDLHEFSSHGDACEARYQGCKLLPEGNY